MRSNITMPASPSSRTRKVGFCALLAMLSALSGCGGGGGGDGSSSDSGFDSTASQLPPTYPWFSYPTAGQLGVGTSQAFSWSAATNAVSYQLQVGTTRGGNDVFDSGIITATSVTVPNLPASGVVYARVRAILKGWSTELPAGDFPQATYVTFRTDTTPTGAPFVSPAPGATNDADNPISWQADPVATGYRLLLADTGGTQLLDTGVINTTRRIVRGLTSGQTINATLYTFYTQNISHSQKLSFVAGNSSVSIKGMFAVARSMAATVRLEADVDDQSYDNTALRTRTLSQSEGYSDCVAFAHALLNEMSDANFPLQTRSRDICYNEPDCHELVDVLNSDLDRWETLDPTFGLYTLNGSGEDATAEEISAAARSLNFGSLSFVYLTPLADTYAKNYYLDYPLLYLELYNIGSTSSFEEAPPASYEPYLNLVGSATTLPVSSYYSVQCAPGESSATANWDGSVETNSCTNGFTPVSWGINVSLVSGNSSASAIWQLHRFVF
jgi:hypothetical protein